MSEPKPFYLRVQERAFYRRTDKIPPESEDSVCRKNLELVSQYVKEMHGRWAYLGLPVEIKESISEEKFATLNPMARDHILNMCR